MYCSCAIMKKKLEHSKLGLCPKLIFKIYLSYIPTAISPTLSSPLYLPHSLPFFYSEKGSPPMNIDKTWHVKL